MTWRVARSLEVLRSQINAAYPNRDKSSDGTIGNAEHSARESDHNPNQAGVVCALDITHDPAHGVDAGALAERLRQSRDPRIKYVISNGRIANYQALNGEAAWTWRPYHGKNDHRHHFHVSVRPEPSLYDDARSWNVGKVVPAPLPPLSINRCQSITATMFIDPVGAYGPIDHDKPGVALPARFPSPRPKVRVFYKGKSVDCDIVDVGPWNISDPYWNRLGGRPQAETGRDTRGRHTNLAGIDLTPAAARAIGLPGLGKVDWEFVGAAKPVPPKDPGQEATKHGILAGIAATLALIGTWIMDHPVLAILGVAALVAVSVFAWRWYRNRQKPAANVEAQDADASSPVPVIVPPPPLARPTDGYIAQAEASSQAGEEGLKAVRDALAVKHKPKPRRKPAKRTPRKANKRKAAKRRVAR